MTIFLEEAGLEYRAMPCDIGRGDQSYALRRFGDEVNRIYGVPNNRLYESHYLAGDNDTAANMVAYDSGNER